MKRIKFPASRTRRCGDILAAILRIARLYKGNEFPMTRPVIRFEFRCAVKDISAGELPRRHGSADWPLMQ